MAELNKLLNRYPDRISAHVLTTKPGNLSDSQTREDNVATHSFLKPAISYLKDPQGTEAHLFCAKTSGFVAFYAPSGQLLFKGGITATRGQKGENPGVSAIVALLNGRHPSLTEAPVHGCSLQEQRPAPLESAALFNK
jgi:hypothetical protein